jgi:Zn-finger nucleic acid-binding protein
MDRQASPVMACPVCRTSLVMSERQDIEIDYCPTCRGVWLDRGELDKIIERSAPATAQPPRGDRRDGDGDRHRFHDKRRKSFFSELFD